MDRWKRARREEAMARASYHSFAARRGWMPGGRDPLSGKSWEQTFIGGVMDQTGRAFARTMHVAAARFWLSEASRLARS